MRCSACRADNPAGKKFCGDCGEALENRCPHCGADNPANKKFCGECGAKIQVSGGGFQVLGSDLRQPTPSTQLDPEAWHTILDRFFAILTEGLHRFEGTVNQYTGDGIMALFGAPIAHEDHAQRACYAQPMIAHKCTSY